MKTRHITILVFLPALLLFTLTGCDSTGETAIADTPAPNGGSNNPDTSGEDAKNSNDRGGKTPVEKPSSANPISDPDSGGDGGKTSPPSNEATNETTDPSTDGGTAEPEPSVQPDPPAEPDGKTSPPNDETTNETTDPSTDGGTAEPEPSPPAPPARPEWTGGDTPPPDYATPTPGNGYTGGSVVFHDGKYYKSKEWTNSEPTGDGNSNWERVRPDGEPWLQPGLDNITAYDPNLTYNGAGYYVTYNGRTYKSNWFVNAGDIPGATAWSPWELVP